MNRSTPIRYRRTAVAIVTAIVLVCWAAQAWGQQWSRAAGIGGSWSIGVERSGQAICGPDGCTVPQPAPTSPSPQYGQQRAPSPQQLLGSTVRVRSTYRDHAAIGSGTLISGREKLVLTCSHVLMLKAGWQISVEFPGGQRSQAEVVVIDALHDAALLRVQSVPQAGQELRLVTSPPAAGSTCTWEGYAGGQGPMRASGQVAGYWAETIIVRGQAQEGVSGGPIYNRDGLVSIVCEVNNGFGWWATVGPHPAWLIRWVAEHRGQSAVTDQAEAPEMPLPDIAGPVADEPDVDGPASAGELNCVRRLVAVEELVAHLDDRVAVLEEVEPIPGPRGPPGPAGPPGPEGPSADVGRIEILEANHLDVRVDVDSVKAKTDGLDVRLAALEDRLRDPVFYVLHRDPETGEMIPQVDPLTGEEHGEQAVHWGDDYTIFLYRGSVLGAVDAGSD